MVKAIYFDMDGTLADFYGVEGWLPAIRNADTTPYKVARPLLNFSALARVLNRLHRNGYTLGVISWTARDGSDEFNERTAAAKRAWLAKHLPSVQFDTISIVDYGTPKHEIAGQPDGIIFDDDSRVREAWTGEAFDVDNIIEKLKSL